MKGLQIRIVAILPRAQITSGLKAPGTTTLAPDFGLHVPLCRLHGLFSGFNSKPKRTPSPLLGVPYFLTSPRKPPSDVLPSLQLCGHRARVGPCNDPSFIQFHGNLHPKSQALERADAYKKELCLFNLKFLSGNSSCIKALCTMISSQLPKRSRACCQKGSQTAWSPKQKDDRSFSGAASWQTCDLIWDHGE